MNDFDSIKRGMASATIRGLALSAALAAAAPAAGQLFGSDLRFAAGDTPLSVSIGDLDGDGAPDLAVANNDSDDVSVLLGAGDGTFAASSASPRGPSRRPLSIGDLDGDGAPDLAVANGGSDDVSVLLGAGDGTFAAQQRFAAGDGPSSVSIGDLDGDGAPDLAVANFVQRRRLGAAGRGRRDLRRRAALRRGGLQPTSVSIGDLDGDGAPDLAVANANSDDVSVLLGVGDGTFAAEQRFAAGDAAVRVDRGPRRRRRPGPRRRQRGQRRRLGAAGRGRRDLRPRAALRRGGLPAVRVDRGPRRRRRPGPRRRQRDSDDVSVLLGLGDGTFAAEQRFAAGIEPRSVSIGDLDGDGAPDLAVANVTATTSRCC